MKRPGKHPILDTIKRFEPLDMDRETLERLGAFDNIQRQVFEAFYRANPGVQRAKLEWDGERMNWFIVPDEEFYVRLEPPNAPAQARSRPQRRR